MLVVRRFLIIKLASRLQFNLYILYPIRFEMRFSLQLDKVIPKCIWNNKEPRIAKAILKKIKVGIFTRPDFKTIYKTIIYLRTVVSASIENTPV